jgi:enediyne biosynthesis protein E4
VTTAIGSEARLFRNVSGGSNHWLAFRLRGVRSNRDGIGARVRLSLPDGKVQFNHATTSVGYGSSSEPLVRFGLQGEKAAREVEIDWPSGAIQILKNVTADRVIEIREPEDAR